MEEVKNKLQEEQQSPLNVDNNSMLFCQLYKMSKAKESTHPLDEGQTDSTVTTKVLIPEQTDLNEFDRNYVGQFPIWGLPKVVQDVINNGAEVYGVPKDFFGTYIFSAICAGLRKNAVLKNKFTNYAQLWIMVVANSGIGKSEPLKLAFSPLLKRDKLMYEQYKDDLIQWKADCVEAKNGKGEEPPRPILNQSLISDTTPEALFQALSRNSGLTLCRDELSGWFADQGRYAKSGEVGHYLSSFNNAQIQINRKGDEPLLITEPYLGVAGSIQPEVLREYIGSKKMADNGFISRFVFAFPDVVIKPEYIDKEMPEEVLTRYEEFINKVCDCNDIHTTLSDEAKELFIKFSNELTNKINDAEHDYLRAMYSKMEIHLSRISLMVYVANLLTRETDEATINAEIMSYSVEVCRYFVATGEKVFYMVNNQPQLPIQELSKGDVIRMLDKLYSIKNITKLGESIGVSQQSISKMLNK